MSVMDNVNLDPESALGGFNAEAKTQAPSPLSKFDGHVHNPETGLSCYIRLPNKFQHKLIQDQALAARMMILRQLRDPDSMQGLAMEAKVEEYADREEGQLREFIVNAHMREAAGRAQLLIECADVDEHPEYADFANMEAIKAQYEIHLRQGDTESDDFKALDKTIHEYGDAFSAKVDELLDPLRATVSGMEKEALLKWVRKIIANQQADARFIEVYNSWEMFYGTRKCDDPENCTKPASEHIHYYFPNHDALLEEDESVLSDLEDRFGKLNGLVMLEGMLGAGPKK